MKAHEIEAKIVKLPNHIILEINDFIDFLLAKYGNKKIDKGKFKFDWQGGLLKLRNKYISVKLQHKASDREISR